MLDLLHGVPMHRLRPHPIHLNRAFRSDLAWWRLFAAEWNGVSFFTAHESPSAPAAGLGRLGFMGLWRILQQPLVPAALGQTIGRAADHGEGAASNCSRLHNMGPGMGPFVRTLSMRQPGGRCQSEVSYKSGQACTCFGRWHSWRPDIHSPYSHSTLVQ